MANGSSRVLPVIVSLALGFAVGWLLHTQPSPPPPVAVPTATPPTVAVTPTPTLIAGHHAIAVGPKAKDLSDDPAPISKEKDHRARWLAQDPNLTLKIVFYAKDFGAPKEPPFIGPRDTDLIITCDPKKRVCDPGKINPRLEPKEGEEGKLHFKYWQYLDGPGFHDEADGMVIIEK